MQAGVRRSRMRLHTSNGLHNVMDHRSWWLARDRVSSGGGGGGVILGLIRECCDFLVLRCQHEAGDDERGRAGALVLWMMIICRSHHQHSLWAMGEREGTLQRRQTPRKSWRRLWLPGGGRQSRWGHGGAAGGNVSHAFGLGKRATSTQTAAVQRRCRRDLKGEGCGRKAAAASCSAVLQRVHGQPTAISRRAKRVRASGPVKADCQRLLLLTAGRQQLHGTGALPLLCSLLDLA